MHPSGHCPTSPSQTISTILLQTSPPVKFPIVPSPKDNTLKLRGVPTIPGVVKVIQNVQEQFGKLQSSPQSFPGLPSTIPPPPPIVSSKK